MNIVDYCVSNKQMGRACVSRINQYEALQPSRKNLPAPREALINAGKMSVKERKVKNACG